MVDNGSQDVAEAVNKTPEAAYPLAVFLEIWQIWLSLDFQIKLLILFSCWLFVNLLLIKIAWHIYGDRLSEILMKEFMSKESNEARLVSEDPLHNKFPPASEKMHRE